MISKPRLSGYIARGLYFIAALLNRIAEAARPRVNSKFISIKRRHQLPSGFMTRLRGGNRRNGGGEGNSGIYCTPALLYLVSKASAPDWEYRVTPYIVTSTNPLQSFLLLCLSMFPLLHPSTLASWNHLLFLIVVTYVSFLRGYHSAFANDECSNELSLVSCFFLFIISKRSGTYYRIFHLKFQEKSRILILKTKNK